MTHSTLERKGLTGRKKIENAWEVQGRMLLVRIKDAAGGEPERGDGSFNLDALRDFPQPHTISRRTLSDRSRSQYSMRSIRASVDQVLDQSTGVLWRTHRPSLSLI